MKKLILSIALVGITAFAFGQKKVVRSASKNFKSGDIEAALTDINAAIQDPETGSDPETYLLKAQIELKKFGSDSSNTMENLAVGEAALETFFKTFEMAGSDKENGLGEDIYEEDLPGVPDNLRPYSILTLKNTAFDKAIIQYNEEDYEMAYEFFNLAGEIDKSDSTIHYNAGFLANDLGRYDDAKKHFTYLFDIPEYNKLNAYYFMVQILSTEEDPEGAYEIIQQAKEEYPSDKVLAEYEIQLLLQLNKMDEAMAQIKEALKNDPENTAILLRSGYLKEQSGDIEGALADYQKSVEIDPDFYEGNYYSGALMLEISRGILAELNGLSDEEWEARSEEMGNKANQYYEDAVPYFEKSLEIRPDDTDIMGILFQIHTRLQNEAEAEKYNQKLIELLGPNWMEG
ncbi:Tetratricopeptide repeat-containing protein [Algoriphagus faecimaris]|uniref:Tetratricopeptide repeat-containing protein n=1 Tax=Algoriphagus faecimaris TaxID=686796 RepID=A0A1G6VBT3_9BACT|nr:tetratricopeptide repeat protein [Algoriphagus faecimaris]SDD51048.1 Tetratricopeptide repeat-containing protein [Algoriphagus faecimaris]